MFYSHHHSNSHVRLHPVTHWNWTRRVKEKWSPSVSRSVHRLVHRVLENRNVRAWQLSNTPELRHKIHAIEVRDAPETDKKKFPFQPKTIQQVLPLYPDRRRKSPRLIWFGLISQRQPLQLLRSTTTLRQVIKDKINRVRFPVNETSFYNHF